MLSVASRNLRSRSCTWPLEQPLLRSAFLQPMILLRSYLDATHLAQSFFAPAGGLTSQDPGAQLKRLREKLRASRAPWKIVIGHHPPRSNGHHGNTEELVELLEPVLQVDI